MRKNKISPHQEVIKITQANGGNGSGQKPNADDIEVYEPVFAPGDEDQEAIGWVKIDVAGNEEEGVILDSELPPELGGDELVS
jgi:hypothetical protein